MVRFGLIKEKAITDMTVVIKNVAMAYNTNRRNDWYRCDFCLFLPFTVKAKRAFLHVLNYKFIKWISKQL
jgi:hypothetical protein